MAEICGALEGATAHVWIVTRPAQKNPWGGIVEPEISRREYRLNANGVDQMIKSLKDVRQKLVDLTSCDFVVE